jgi:hypothetical protein
LANKKKQYVMGSALLEIRASLVFPPETTVEKIQQMARDIQKYVQDQLPASQVVATIKNEVICGS